MLRRATRFDSDILSMIHAASFPADEAWRRDVFDLQLAIPNVFALLHISGGLILVRVAADEAEILTFAVDPLVRRRGFGRGLLAAAIATAMNMGARAMFLEVSVANIAARTLYTNAGFSQAGCRPKYYSDLSDALVLRLNLDQAN